MLSWLRGIAGRIGADISSTVAGVVHSVAAGVAALVTLVFGRVTEAWHDFYVASAVLEAAVAHHAKALYGRLDAIITHWIPHYAMTAWWWVTNPHELARVLTWHIVGWLERWAFIAARYLGEFTLHLLTGNLRRVLHLAEDVIVAVL